MCANDVKVDAASGVNFVTIIEHEEAKERQNRQLCSSISNSP
jgi:hypothetical protein